MKRTRQKKADAAIPVQPQIQNPISTQITITPSINPQKDRSDSAGSGSGQDRSSEGDSTTGDYKPGRKSGRVQVDSGKIFGIIVSHRFRNGVVNFFINSEQRPETDVIGGGQGDHTTAYTAIIQAILSSTGSMGIESAIESLKEFGQIVLKGDGKGRFCAIKKPEVHSDGFRGKIKSALKFNRNSTGVTDVDMDIVNRGLKDNKINKLSEYLCDLATCFLEEIQQGQAAYYSKGRADKDANEGNIVKSASRALLVLDKLCRLCDLDDKKFKKELESFLSSLAPKKKSDDSTEEDHVVRYGLNILHREEVVLTGDEEEDKRNNAEATSNAAKRTEQFAIRLKSAKTMAEKRMILQQARDQLLSDPNKISTFIGDLFDYKREIVFKLTEAVPLTASQNKRLTQKDERKKFRQEEIQKYLNPGQRSNYIFDFTQQDNDGNDVAKVTREYDDELIITIDKHFKITWAAFPNLNKQLEKQAQQHTAATSVSLQPCKKAEVESSFLTNKILKKQGWEKATYEKKDYTIVNLTTDYLKQQIINRNQKLLQQLGVDGR
jgi:hypothetical protein